jgi:hypothetical protein
MNRWVSIVAVMVGLLALAHIASAATSTVVLGVEGMT